MKQSGKTAQLSKAERDELKKGLYKFLSEVETRYDKDVDVLLKAIASAEKKGDIQTLKKTQKIAETWIDFFEAMKKEFLANSKSPLEKSYIKFSNDQIDFFKALIKEVDRKIKGTKMAGMRRSLEKK